MDYAKGKLLYQNPLSSPADVKDFVLEGSAEISFPNGAMRLRSVIDPAQAKGELCILVPCGVSRCYRNQLGVQSD